MNRENYPYHIFLFQFVTTYVCFKVVGNYMLWLIDIFLSVLICVSCTLFVDVGMKITLHKCLYFYLPYLQSFIQI